MTAKRLNRLMRIGALQSELSAQLSRFTCAAVPAWNALRRASGDSHYEDYLAHWSVRHAGDEPLSRRAFYEAELDRRWSSISRCC